jgi:hypothetical protein
MLAVKVWSLSLTEKHCQVRKTFRMITGASLADSPRHFVNLDGTVIASHEGLEKICSWDADGRLVSKADNTLILAGKDGSREELAIPGQISNPILCKSLGPQTILISGRDANTFETNLWLISPGREPRLIAREYCRAI